MTWLNACEFWFTFVRITPLFELFTHVICVITVYRHATRNQTSYFKISLSKSAGQDGRTTVQVNHEPRSDIFRPQRTYTLHLGARLDSSVMHSASRGIFTVFLNGATVKVKNLLFWVNCFLYEQPPYLKVSKPFLCENVRPSQNSDKVFRMYSFTLKTDLRLLRLTTQASRDCMRR